MFFLNEWINGFLFLLAILCLEYLSAKHWNLKHNAVLSWSYLNKSSDMLSHIDVSASISKMA